jgi:ubiquinone/menaquinone biosynthesis C-methylase UbiE
MRAAERRYYDRRAPEYDDWYLGRGPHAAMERPEWDEEMAALVFLLRSLPPARVLDVGCGTAFLTQHLRGEVTGLDQSEAMLEIARTRLPDASFVRGDALALPFADRSFDRVLTAHFYGHLREHDRAHFLAEARRVGGELVVVDAGPHSETGEAEEVQERFLNDGSRHLVYKRYFSADRLAAELGDGRPLLDGKWFVAVSA